MQSKISVARRNKINTMAYRKIEEYDEKTTKELAGHVKAILKLLGEDPEREGLVKTPERVAKAWQFLTQGYEQNGETIVRSAVFTEPYSQMVLVKDIELFSLCEHHMLPFIGKAHVAYIPNGRITGLSKIARVVETYARRLQVQERLTEQIRDCIQESSIRWASPSSSKPCTPACPCAAWRSPTPSRQHRPSPGSSSNRTRPGTSFSS